MMKPEDFLMKIKQIEWQSHDDIETMHARMDDAMEDLLCDLGYGEAIEYMRGLERWYA